MPPRIFYNAVRFVMAALFILTALVWPGQAQALNGAWAQELMLEGDALFNQRGDLAKAREAAECYRGGACGGARQLPGHPPPDPYPGLAGRPNQGPGQDG